MKKILIGLILFSPAIMLANSDGTGLSGFLGNLTGLANQAYALIIALIVLAFAWGVLKFVFQSGDDQAKGKNMMIWSIIAITVLFSIWGIVRIFQETVGVDGGDRNINAPAIPTIN